MPYFPKGSDLYDWDDIKGITNWDGVLIGNGFSINISKSFSYNSIFKIAVKNKFLSEKEEALFEQFNTSNFESVIDSIQNIEKACNALNISKKLFSPHKKSIKEAFMDCISNVHIKQGALESRIDLIRKELLEYEQVFTTNYDLILYWAINPSDKKTLMKFSDHFKKDRAFKYRKKRCNIHFLHGGLHLTINKKGKTFTNNIELLTLYKNPPKGERPLIILEGDYKNKEKIIENSDYLEECHQKLGEQKGDFLIFGHNLNISKDKHIVDRIRNNGMQRKIAVSIFRGKKRSNKSIQYSKTAIYNKLCKNIEHEIYFFDSSTHPFGC